MICGKFFIEASLVNKPAFTRDPTHDMGARMTSLMIGLDAGASMEYSFNGVDVHGKIYYDDQFISFDDYDCEKIWLRASVNVSYRLWAWVKQR